MKRNILMGLWLLLTAVNAYATSIPTETGKPYSGTLPVLYINTDDRQPITSKEEYQSGDMLIQNNTETSAPMYDISRSSA